MKQKVELTVDTLDKMCAWYSCKRLSRRWPVRLFFGLLDITSVNAFVIWTELNPTWKCSNSGKQPSDLRRLFLLAVGKCMVMSSVERRSLSQAVTFLPATRRAVTAVGLSPARKTSEPAESGYRESGVIFVLPNKIGNVRSTAIPVICLFVVTTAKQYSHVTRARNR